MDRRAFLFVATSGFIVRSLGQGTGGLYGQELGHDGHSDETFAPGEPDQINRWMEKWRTRGYHGPLILSRFVEPIYFLYLPIRWVPNKGTVDPRMATFTVPKGFVTDLASIPRVFWSLLRPDGNYAYAAILHDYLYWTQSRPREAADAILRQSMFDFKVSSLTVNTIYEAVRVGGQPSWDQNRRLKERGERRVLSAFPEDPTTSWLTWKADKNHFLPMT